jgi:hypothetical protein
MTQNKSSQIFVKNNTFVSLITRDSAQKYCIRFQNICRIEYDFFYKQGTSARIFYAFVGLVANDWEIRFIQSWRVFSCSVDFFDSTLQETLATHLILWWEIFLKEINRMCFQSKINTMH